MSIPQHSDPCENAVVERVKGILKDEFGLGGTLPYFVQAEALVARSYRVQPYVASAWHLQLHHLESGAREEALVQRWKNYYQLVPKLMLL